MSGGHQVLTKRDAVAALLLALLVILTGSLRIAPGVCGVFHDDAIYVSTAKALASGQGYRLIDVPGAPLQTKYPILYPAILAAVWWFSPGFPANLVAMQAITLLFGAAVVASAYLYLVRFNYCTRNVAMAGGLICATASYFIYYAVQTMAEMPFTFFLVAALWGIELLVSKPEASRRAQFAWGLVLALPFLCRTIGITVIVSSLWVLWLHRRPIRYCASGAAALALPWILFSMLGRGIWDSNPVHGYYTDYIGCWSSTGISMMERVCSLNLLMIAHGTALLLIEGCATIAQSLFGAWQACIPLMLVGSIPWLAMVPDLFRGRVMPWMLAGYLAAMIVWPWPPNRFLVPILPFLASYALMAVVRMVSERKANVGWRFAGATAIAAIVATNVWLLKCHADQLELNHYPLPSIRDDSGNSQSYARVFAWLLENTDPEDIVASGLDSMVALYSGRPAIRPYVYEPDRLFYSDGPKRLLSPEELAQILIRQKPAYLVQTPMAGFAEEDPFNEALEALRQLYPDWLVIVYQDSDPRFVVYELRAGATPELHGAPSVAQNGCNR